MYSNESGYGSQWHFEHNNVFKLCRSKLKKIDALLQHFDDSMMQFQLTYTEYDKTIMSARVGINENLYHRKFQLIRVISKEDVGIKEAIKEVYHFFKDIESMISDNITIPALAEYLDSNLKDYFTVDYIFKTTYDCILYAAYQGIIRDHNGVNDIDTYIECLQAAKDMGTLIEPVFYSTLKIETEK